MSKHHHQYPFDKPQAKQSKHWDKSCTWLAIILLLFLAAEFLVFRPRPKPQAKPKLPFEDYWDNYQRLKAMSDQELSDVIFDCNNLLLWRGYRLYLEPGLQNRHTWIHGFELIETTYRGNTNDLEGPAVFPAN